MNFHDKMNLPPYFATETKYRGKTNLAIPKDNGQRLVKQINKNLVPISGDLKESVSLFAILNALHKQLW